MKTDVVISWSFATVPAAQKAAFERPTTFVELPTPAGRKYGQQVQGFGWPMPLKGILAKYAPGVEPLRIAALGFSESCGGVGVLLKSDDGGKFDAAIALDGIHTAPGKQLQPAALAQWVAFARRAAEGVGLCVITHSSVVPPYASTTQTANYIWEQAAETTDYVAIPAAQSLPGGAYSTTIGPPLSNSPYTITYADNAELAIEPRRANGLVVLGWKNKDGPGYADHRRQANPIREAVLTRYLAARWNNIDPSDPSSACYVG